MVRAAQNLPITTTTTRTARAAEAVHGAAERATAAARAPQSGVAATAGQPDTRTAPSAAQRQGAQQVAQSGGAQIAQQLQDRCPAERPVRASDVAATSRDPAAGAAMGQRIDRDLARFRELNQPRTDGQINWNVPSPTETQAAVQLQALREGRPHGMNNQQIAQAINTIERFNCTHR